MSIAPRWALDAQVLHSAEDPHLAPGIHIRIAPSALIGLPIAPFIIYRLNLGRHARNIEQLHTDNITWIDSRGVTIIPPFDVTPDNPVTGYLPPPSRGDCCWIEVDVKETTVDASTDASASEGGEGEESRTLLNFGAEVERIESRANRVPVRIDAVVTTPRGPAVVVTRTSSPYHLSSPHIERVIVTGSGSVNGVRWLDSNLIKDGDWGEPWRLLSLPISEGARYYGIPDAAESSRKRVIRGAPLKFGLHDYPDASSPAACASATPEDEESRVDNLIGEIYPYLDRLINDTRLPAWNLFDRKEVLQNSDRDNRARRIGNVQINLLISILQASLDPGVGRWLGLVDVDDDPPSSTAGDVIAYRISGIWAVEPNQLGPYTRLLQNEMLRYEPPSPIFFEGYRILEKLPEGVSGPFLHLSTIVCATIKSPPHVPPPPALETPVSGKYWLPSRPPTALREVTLPMREITAGATIAAARLQGSRDGGTGTKITSLNRKQPTTDRAINLVLSIPEDAHEPGQGKLFDSAAPGDEFLFQVAQADWFGRWSDWSQRYVPRKERPRPPRPILFVGYNPPKLPGAREEELPLSGQLKIQVPVPAVPSLSPGSNLLSSLEIVVSGGLQTTKTIKIEDPDSPPEQLSTIIPGPPLDRAASSTVQIIARWSSATDTGAVVSDNSETIIKELHDIRGPPQVSLPNTLEYGSRPDVTGHSRIAVKWTPQSPHSQRFFRVFYADETRVLEKLREISQTTGHHNRLDAQDILNQISRLDSSSSSSSSGSTAPLRAAIYREKRTILERGMFELLTEDPLVNHGVGPMIFEHSVSGSLRVLCLYRVVSVGAGQAESDFKQSPLAIYAVPNTPAPPQPFLSVKPEVIRMPSSFLLPLVSQYRVKISIEIPRGMVKARKYRVRRSITRFTDPMRMPIVATGQVPAANNNARGEGGEGQGEDQIQKVPDFLDFGAWDHVAPDLKLQPWNTYFYQVEVQAGPEPGSRIEGQWSVPSAVATAAIIIPDPPSSAIDVSAQSDGTRTEVKFRHTEELRGGTLGQYIIDIYKQKPDEGREVRVAEMNGDQRSADRWYRFYDETATPVAGTVYRIIVRDPIGRPSPPSARAITK